MNYTTQEWLNLVFRWFHVFAGILWIGQTWLFAWLDARLHDPDEKGEVWMVHSGGFYVVHKELKPHPVKTVHWFKWEAALTWLSGLALLIVVYYLGGLLVNPENPLPLGTAIAYSVGLLILAWPVYDFLWMSPLGKNEVVGGVLSFALLLGLSYLTHHLFSARAAYLQVGAVMGTLMAANVWMRILPAQRRLIAAAAAGETPDQRLADRAKTRSKHNTFMVVPLVLIMLSNHFPVATYGNSHNWLVLGGIILVGWVAAAVVRAAR